MGKSAVGNKQSLHKRGNAMVINMRRYSRCIDVQIRWFQRFHVPMSETWDISRISSGTKKGKKNSGKHVAVASKRNFQQKPCLDHFWALAAELLACWSYLIILVIATLNRPGTLKHQWFGGIRSSKSTTCHSGSSRSHWQRWATAPWWRLWNKECFQVSLFWIDWLKGMWFQEPRLFSFPSFAPMANLHPAQFLPVQETNSGGQVPRINVAEAEIRVTR